MKGAKSTFPSKEDIFKILLEGNKTISLAPGDDPDCSINENNIKSTKV